MTVVVKIEVWPGGDEARGREIGRAVITNLGGKREDAIGNYSVQLMRSSERATPGVWRSGSVRDFPRKKLSVYDLLFCALRATIGYRNR